MKINNDKSKTAVFNASKSRDFYPRILDSNGKMYENVDKFTLLGVDFASHPIKGGNWEDYILKCVKKAYNKMWILKRLAEKGVSQKDLLMTYTSRIRIHLELNVSLWHFSINKNLSKIIERVQRACSFIILGKSATPDYSSNLAVLELDRLDERRDKLSIKLAKKIIKHPEHRKMFQWKQRSKTRVGPKVVIPKDKTKRYSRRAVPSLARIINNL